MNNPKIRFKHDDETEFPNWEMKKLGELTKQITVTVKNNIQTNYTVYSVNNQKGFIPQTDQFEDREVASKDKSNYRIVNHHQFAYNPSRINVGSIAYLRDNMPVIVSPLYVVFECLSTLNPKFLDIYVRTFDFHKQRQINTAGSVRDSLSYDGFANIKIPVPHLEEQQKISDFLSAVDEVIAQTDAEVHNLEQQKKAAMQKIFSQEVRFRREEGEYPKWKDYRLEDVVIFLDEKRKPITSKFRKKGEYPYYGATGIIDYIDNYIFDEELILLSEDGANIVDRNYRISYIAIGKFWVNNHAHCLRAKEGFSSHFISEGLESIDYTMYNTGSAQPKLNQEVCRNLPIKCPCLEEQQKIADFLSAFDEAIGYAKQELDKWKELKKGLLQQMFV
ncbi:MAG: restriction endonuclease subunit S [Lachnospiraceae bacterium]|nr:restriction endonuclease subunit S [Ruminococcus sp.]MCM1276499.1 restriction endonuclease subunit S [Lachnospiraceae bacterium]